MILINAVMKIIDQGKNAHKKVWKKKKKFVKL